MDSKNTNQITFTYNDRNYCLEYTRESIKMMESSGFNINDVGDKPATRVEQLWAGAFLANHRNTSNNIIKTIYTQMKNKQVLLEKLSEMYNNTLNYLLSGDEDGESGNVEWTASL